MRNWKRLLAQFALNAVVFVGVVYVVLWLSGRYLTVQQSGGDQSQSSLIDAGPAVAVESLPMVDWPEVKNVLLIVGDGMGFSQVMAARSELKRLNEKLFLERFPVTGWQTTHSLDAIYTDSAASASALATGRKVEYLAVSMSPDGVPHRTLLEAARDRGMAIGAITDSYLWDATPASFLAHTPARRNMFDIGSQMARSGARILVGEAHDELDLDTTEPNTGAASLRQQFHSAGYRIAETAESIAGLDPRSEEPVIGLFPPGQIADRQVAPELPDLVDFALAKLSRHPDGFFLLIESEEPDSGGHRRNLKRVVAGIEDIDEMAAAAVELALADRATLVLITADHETGGMAILHGDAEHNLGVRWSTGSHSAEPVPIYAFGAAAGRFTGVRDNTDLARTLSELLDLGMFD